MTPGGGGNFNRRVTEMCHLTYHGWMGGRMCSMESMIIKSYFFHNKTALFTGSLGTY